MESRRGRTAYLKAAVSFPGLSFPTLLGETEASSFLRAFPGCNLQGLLLTTWLAALSRSKSASTQPQLAAAGGRVDAGPARGPSFMPASELRLPRADAGLEGSVPPPGGLLPATPAHEAPLRCCLCLTASHSFLSRVGEAKYQK